MLIRDLFKKVSSVSSKTEKEQLLKDNDSPLLRMILEDTYGPAKYNIKKYEIIVPEEGSQLNIEDHYQMFRDMLTDLSKRKVTGNAAKTYVGSVLGCFEEEDRMWLQRILDKNLKIGAGNTFSEDTGINTKFPVALANKIQDAKDIDIFDGTWDLSRKLDGCRCLVFITSLGQGNVNVSCRSRKNKELTTLDVLKQDYERMFANIPGDYVVDGEVCLVDEYGNESFQGLMSEVTRKNHTISNPKHLVFDFLTDDEFWGLAKSPNLNNRLQKFEDIIEKGEYEHVSLLHQEVLETKEQLTEWQELAKKCGWEGLMIRKNNIPYEGKRSNNLLKIKQMQDAEYVVKDVVIGDLTFAVPGEGNISVYCVGALVIEHKGNEVKVGSGLTRDQRIRWRMYPEEIIGKTITVQYFEETVDKKTGMNSLRFPTLKYVYEDGREV